MGMPAEWAVSSSKKYPDSTDSRILVALKIQKLTKLYTQCLMLQCSQLWSLTDRYHYGWYTPTCEEHAEAADEESQKTSDGSRDAPRALSAPVAPEKLSHSCRITVVGVEHDGLLLLARQWSTCTEIGWVQSDAAQVSHSHAPSLSTYTAIMCRRVIGLYGRCGI